MAERLLHLTVWAGVGAGCALLLAVPEALILGWGHPLLPGTVHLFTLGGILSAAYLVQQGLWRRLYGPAAPWAPLLVAAWALHAGGVALLAWGFLRGDSSLAYWGGHYGVPTGVVLALAHGWVAAARRPAGSPRRAAAHLPGMGLAVAMALGALLVMDARTGRYGVYTLDTILAHLLAAGFLFVLPQVLLPRALAPAEPAAGTGGTTSTLGSPDEGAALPPGVAALLRWYAAVACGAGGVLAVVLGQAGAGPARLLPLGLALLGALLVWLGLPESRGRFSVAALLPLAGRLASGVLLFYAALRTARGLAPGDALWLGKVGVLLFGLGVALPELLALLERDARAAGTTRRQALWVMGTAALLAGQLWALPGAVRLGALLWLAGLAWHAWVVNPRRGG